MEEKKNNATEKVENISLNDSVKSPDDNSVRVRKTVTKSSTAKSRKTGGSKDNKQQKTERAAADKRISAANAKKQQKKEKQKLKEQKKELKKTALAAKKEAKERKREEYKLEKLKKKEARIARRDMLKNESKKDRLKRIEREKQQKQEQKRLKRDAIIEKREQRAALKRQRLANKRALKEQKRKLRSEDNRDKRSRGTAGWLAAVISLGCTTLVLATLFTLALTTRMGGSDPALENSIERSFYDFVNYVDNMDVNLSKLMVSSDAEQQQKILTDLSLQASLAASDVTALPIQDESKFYTTKFVNQVGDYAKYLNEKLIEGGKITADDKANLSQLYSINNQLKTELAGLSSELNENYSFTSLTAENSDDAVLSKFSELEKNAVDYPKLIYDGPFSDALSTTEAKGLSEEEVSQKEAEEKFKSYFKTYEYDTFETTGDSKGIIETYNIEAKKEGKIVLYAQISKKGGSLIFFECYKECTKSEYDLTACLANSEKFISSIGIKNMKGVWATESGNTAYINYAYEKGGIIYYPDMIKVTVCQERGIVSSFDAKEYYLNHTTRTAKKATLSKKEAIKNLSTDITVNTVRLAVVPVGNSEALTYEVMGTFNGSTYYIYVDAVSGKEVQIFKVVETTEGTLLM